MYTKQCFTCFRGLSQSKSRLVELMENEYLNEGGKKEVSWLKWISLHWQVQRCAEDRTILITTYEGTHNHPLPPAAIAMASTTSSAAKMLLSGSMPSADGLMNSNFFARTLLPCSSSMATISASAPFPTVTLDLTQSPNPLQFPRPPNQFQIPFSNPPHNNILANPAALLPQIFGQALYNQSKFSGLQSSQDLEGQQHPSTMPSSINPSNHNPVADTVNALTSDPNFTAALAAAITSLIGNPGQPNNGTNNTIATTTTPANNNNNSVTSNGNNNNNGSNNKVTNSSFPANWLIACQLNCCAHIFLSRKKFFS